MYDRLELKGSVPSCHVAFPRMFMTKMPTLLSLCHCLLRSPKARVHLIGR